MSALRGVSAQECVCVRGCATPVDRMTDACENITFPVTAVADGNY